jgi:TRAP-type C4-dicarboxylate transport system permease small subunit
MRLRLTTGSKLRGLIAHAEGILLWILTLMLVIDVLLGILARYVQFEVVFADELGKYIFIWLCCVGISAATRDNQHVRLTFISSLLPFSRRLVRLLSQLLFLSFSLFFLYWSISLTWMHIKMQKSVMGFHFPMYFFTAALPVGFALNSLRLIQDIEKILKKSNDQHKTSDTVYERGQ